MEMNNAELSRCDIVTPQRELFDTEERDVSVEYEFIITSPTVLHITSELRQNAHLTLPVLNLGPRGTRKIAGEGWRACKRCRAKEVLKKFPPLGVYNGAALQRGVAREILKSRNTTLAGTSCKCYLGVD